jgi:hypothetical protein
MSQRRGGAAGRLAIGRMVLRLRDVQSDPIAHRALKELMHRFTVAEEKSGLVLTTKSGDMELLLDYLDDLHQLVFVQKHP